MSGNLGVAKDLAWGFFSYPLYVVNSSEFYFIDFFKSGKCGELTHEKIDWIEILNKSVHLISLN